MYYYLLRISIVNAKKLRTNNNNNKYAFILWCLFIFVKMFDKNRAKIQKYFESPAPHDNDEAHVVT